VLEATPVEFVPGGNMALWRDVLDEAGGFDPEYTDSAWREETDLCVRVRNRGYEILFVPNCEVEHEALRLKSGAKRKLRFQYSVARNEAYFVSKHRPGVVASALSIAVGPLKSTARDFARAAYGIVALPVRIAGGLAGYARGRRSR
jgi:GT2 family glycosyltransferase